MVQSPVIYDMITFLDKEAAIAREKLEKDLQSTKAQLKQNKHTNTDFAERKPITGSVSNSETDVSQRLLAGDMLPVHIVIFIIYRAR